MSSNEKLNRRIFLKSTLLGASGAMLSRHTFAAGIGTKDVDKKIITRALGKTGIELPVVSMGVMNADNPNLVKAAFEGGMKHFDTAHGYQRGNNEEMLGKVFKDIPRNSFIISTKIPAGERGSGGYTKEQFLERLDISLKRLQMDHVDMLYTHGVTSREDMLNETVLDALSTAKKDGRTRFIGLSTHRNEPEVIEAAIETGIIDVILTAINFKQDYHPELKAAIASGAEQGIGFIGMKNLAGGFLDQEKQHPVNVKAAIKWVLQDTNITTCIPGFTAFDQLEADLELLTNITITEEELNSLGLASNEMGIYCQGCGECLRACKKSLPIPDIMRAYMYAYGYGNMEKAYTTLEEYDVPVNPCSDCEICTVQCPQNFPVAEKISKITRLRDVPRDFIT
jgi:predicted aldo/keto reductase-like oxidoreductase